jgi:hypothetical protein
MKQQQALSLIMLCCVSLDCSLDQTEWMFVAIAPDAEGGDQYQVAGPICRP